MANKRIDKISFIINQVNHRIITFQKKILQNINETYGIKRQWFVLNRIEIVVRDQIHLPNNRFNRRLQSC